MLSVKKSRYENSKDHGCRSVFCAAQKLQRSATLFGLLSFDVGYVTMVEIGH